MNKNEINIPINVEAEKLVLGPALNNQRDLDVLSTQLFEDAFFDIRHKLIFNALHKFWMDSYTPSVIDVSRLLKDDGKLEDAGGFEYISGLSVEYVSSSVTHYSNIVLDVFKKRKMLYAAQKCLLDISGGAKTGKILAGLSDAMVSMAGLGVSGPRTMTDIFKYGADGTSIISEIMKKYEKYKSGDLSLEGVETGFSKLDLLLDGLVKGRLTIFGARPSMGKSEFTVQCVSRMMKKRTKSLIFSMEMTGTEWAHRLLGIISSVHFSRFKNMSPLESEQVNEGYKIIQAHTEYIIVDDAPGLTIEDIKGRAIREINKNGIDVIFIDHLGLIEGPGNNQYEKVTKISKRLKELSKELNIPIFCLCQLSRKVVDKSDPTPTMADLRDSGSIEQDADAVILLHRPDYYDKYKDPGIVKLIVDKNRQGMEAVISLSFNYVTGLLDDIEDVSDIVDRCMT